jgi:hypothetical protein
MRNVQKRGRQEMGSTMVYAVESWILALMGWAWLTFQEMWAWSLLSAHVFYGLIWLSTCNVIASGVAPESPAPRSAYFAAVLGLTLYSTCGIFDTLPMPTLGPMPFEPPTGRPDCTFAKATQVFFFSNLQIYLVQAGVTLAYLVIQLVVSGAALLDTELRTLWPGPAWGGGLAVMLCGRYISLFDGMAKGLTAQSKYLEIFSLPIAEFVFLFYGFMYLLGILTATDGLLFPGVAWRKSVRYVTFVVTFLFIAFAGYALGVKGLLTMAQLALLVLLLIPAIVGLVEAVRAGPDPPASRSSAVPAPSQTPAAWAARPATQVFQWQPSAPAYQPQWAQTRQVVPTRQLRHVIPSPVEMIGEKNKAI